MRRKPVVLASRPEKFDGYVAALDITAVAQPLAESRDSVCLRFRRAKTEVPDHRYRLLRPRRERPCRGAAEQSDELAARNHSITSSARASSVGGTSMPSALAVFRLMARFTFVDCITGRLAGFSPRRI